MIWRTSSFVWRVITSSSNNLITSAFLCLKPWWSSNISAKNLTNYFKSYCCFLCLMRLFFALAISYFCKVFYTIIYIIYFYSLNSLTLLKTHLHDCQCRQSYLTLSRFFFILSCSLKSSLRSPFFPLLKFFNIHYISNF